MAAPGYLADEQRATAPSDWLDQALTYATSAMSGTVSILTPVAAGMGSISGYTVADYLVRYGGSARAGESVPDTTWRALAAHLADDGDLLRTGSAAEEHLRFRYAETLYSAAVRAGSVRAGLRLADLLHLQDRTGEALHQLRRIETDHAALRTARVLGAAGRLNELRELADAGDSAAADRLVDLLAEQAQVDELRERADAGDFVAAHRLVDLLAEDGQGDEAIAYLNALAAAGDQQAPVRQAELLAELGRAEESMWILRPLVDVGNGYAAARMAELLADHGLADELHQLADTDNQAASAQLARLLADRGDLDALRTRANAGDAWAADHLSTLLGRHNGEDQHLANLRHLADIGLAPAAAKLARLLARRGEADELRARAVDGDSWSVAVMVDALDGATDDDQLMTIARRLARTPGWTGQRMRALLATRPGDRYQERVAGRYRLIGPLGSGWSGATIWRAYDEELGRPVAVKMLAGAGIADADVRQRIRAEAQTVLSLSHPNMTRVFDFGESVAADGSITPYLVTEPPAGRSLRRQLASGPLPGPPGLRVVADVAAALAALHSRGVVHGDIKPENILFTPTGAKAMLIDFGTASVTGQSQTHHVTVREGPYRAPEELSGEAPHAASDVYALGVLLYEVLTGDLPWPVDPLDEPPPGREPRPLPDIDEMPPQVARICGRCLSTSPASRPGSRAVARALAAAASGPATKEGASGR